MKQNGIKTAIIACVILLIAAAPAFAKKGKKRGRGQKQQKIAKMYGHHGQRGMCNFGGPACRMDQKGFQRGHQGHRPQQMHRGQGRRLQMNRGQRGMCNFGGPTCRMNQKGFQRGQGRGSQMNRGQRSMCNFGGPACRMNQKGFQRGQGRGPQEMHRGQGSRPQGMRRGYSKGPAGQQRGPKPTCNIAAPQRGPKPCNAPRAIQGCPKCKCQCFSPSRKASAAAGDKKSPRTENAPKKTGKDKPRPKRPDRAPEARRTRRRG